MEPWKKSGKDYCFTVKGNNNTNEEEITFMLGDDVIILDSDATMADIMAISGIYNSKTKARKDGWNKPIPNGFWDKIIGKMHTHIWIWNPGESVNMQSDE